jgi:hypothetical protein
MVMGPEIDKSALIIVDMQNDFIHPDGDVGIRGRGRTPRRGLRRVGFRASDFSTRVSYPNGAA